MTLKNLHHALFMTCTHNSQDFLIRFPIHEYFELPACEAVYAKHFGSYDSGNTHYAIEAYMKANEIDYSGAYIWEVYITDPMNEPDTAKWQTDIYYPVK